jgi:hypothetical protein
LQRATFFELAVYVHAGDYTALLGEFVARSKNVVIKSVSNKGKSCILANYVGKRSRIAFILPAVSVIC